MTAATTLDAVLAAFVDEIGPAGPVAIEGGRTRWSIGGLPADGTRLVRAPVGIVEYQPEEMVVRVRAGTPVADLHAELTAAGQTTALPERGGTVGGAIAVGENAVAIGRVGRVRASVLQVRYVSSDGRLVTGGGPTVKNVSGFDLPRILTGSLGTLGCVGEVVLRTHPLPARSVWLVGTDLDPFGCARDLRTASAVLWDGTTTSVLLEGHPGDVEHDRHRLAGDVTEGERPVLPAHRWSVRPSELRSLDGTGAFVASVGVGTVWAERPQPERRPDTVSLEVGRRLRDQFDPTRRFNPGRTVAGVA